MKLELDHAIPAAAFIGGIVLGIMIGAYVDRQICIGRVERFVDEVVNERDAAVEWRDITSDVCPGPDGVKWIEARDWKELHVRENFKSEMGR